ncbi:NlpC/P60 family protein [Sphingomonas sp.]|uniref:NlpC/P60 family protein n=1 Tax=Sphingomonas sp. TaxID=28214 RepID=UPI002EDB89F4
MTPLERARCAIGAKFRLHGRTVADGLDCVGLAGLAFGAVVPRGYSLRSGDTAQMIAGIAAAGLVRAGDARAGDLVLFRAGPGQLHLGIDGGGSVIHADAALRRVVERPGTAPWPELMRWRRPETTEG